MIVIKQIRKHWLKMLIAIIVLIAFHPRFKAVRKARRLIGIDETGNNAGFDNAKFEALMKKYGWRKGWAWCMSFVRAMWMESYKHLRNDLGYLLSHSTVTTWNNFVKNKSGKFETSQKPTIGAIVIWRKYAGGVATSKGHAGIVEKINNDGTIQTIEGNTNEAGSREGETIARKTRKLDFTNPNGLRMLGFIKVRLIKR